MDLTIYTVTYNRSELLYQLFKSILKAQKYSCQVSFTWHIFINGLNKLYLDNINKIKDEANFKLIITENPKNIGLTKALNILTKKIRSDYSIRIDDDDLVLKNFFETFENIRNKINEDQNIGGSVHPVIDFKGDIIGRKSNKKYFVTSNYDLYFKYRLIGDKSRIYKTNVLKKYKYPYFNEENFVPDSYIYFLIDSKYKLLYSDEIFQKRKYLNDGLTKSASKVSVCEYLFGLLDYYSVILRHEQISNMKRFEINLKIIKNINRCNAPINYFEFIRCNMILKPMYKLIIFFDLWIYKYES